MDFGPISTINLRDAQDSVQSESIVDEDGAFVGNNEPSTWDIVTSTFKADALGRNVNASWARSEEAYDKRIEIYKRVTGQELQNPERMTNFGRLAQSVNRLVDGSTGSIYDDFRKRELELFEKHPELKNYIDPEADIRSDAALIGRRAEQTMQERMDAYQGWLKYPAMMAGSMGAMLVDPTNAAAMLVGPMGAAGPGLRGIAMMALRSGAYNAAVEAALQPYVQYQRNQIGLPSGIGHAAMDVASAAAFGFLVDAGGRSIWRGGKAGVQAGRRVLGIEEPKVRDSEPAAAPEAPPKIEPELIERVESGDIDAAREFAAKVGIDQEPAVRGALNGAEDYVDLMTTVHLEGVDDGARERALLQAYRSTMDEAEPPPRIPDPTPDARSPRLADDAELPGEFTIGDRQASKVMLDLRKAEADVESLRARVTDLERQGRLDTDNVGRVIAFEEQGGKRILVDGRQRKAMADAEDVKADAEAILLREKDGWTLDDARKVGIKKNLQDGTIRGMEAARLLRGMPDLIDSNLPDTLTTARLLSRLSDNAFDMVEAGDLSPRAGALVADLVEDPTRHAGIAERVGRLEDDSPAAVRQEIGDALRDEADMEQTQAIILGGVSNGLDGLGPVGSEFLGALPIDEMDSAVVRAMMTPGTVANRFMRQAARAADEGQPLQRVMDAFDRRIMDALDNEGVDALTRRSSDEPRLIDDPNGPEARALTEELLDGAGERVPDGQLRDAIDAQRMAREIEDGEIGGDNTMFALSNFDRDPVTPGLDMSKEARLQRARDMGFDTEQVWYNGSAVAPKSFDLSFANKYNRNPGDIVGVWFSESRKRAEWYSQRHADKYNYRRQRKLRTLLDKIIGRKPSFDSAYAPGAITDVYIKPGNQVTIDMNIPENQERMVSLVKKAIDDGADTIVLKDHHDILEFDANGKQYYPDELIVLDPSNIRSVNAAFDPARSDSSNLMFALSGNQPPGNFTDMGRNLIRQDELGYYSKALEAARSIKQEKGTPEQMLSQLRKAGVKEAEIDAVGLDKVLAQSPLDKYASNLIGKDIVNVHLVGSTARGEVGRDIDLVYDLGNRPLPSDPIDAAEQVTSIIEGIDKTIDLDSYDSFFKVGDRYFHASSGAGREIVENTSYAMEQAGKPSVALGSKQQITKSAIIEHLERSRVEVREAVMDEGQPLFANPRAPDPRQQEMAMQLRQQAMEGGLTSMGDPQARSLTPLATYDWPDVRRGLDEIIARLPDEVRFEVEDRLVFRDNRSGQSYALDGYFDPDEMLIKVSLASNDPVRMARHEEIHAYRQLGLLRDEEWDAFTRFARENGMREQYGVDGKYGEVYGRRYNDPDRLESALMEETIAEMFADRVGAGRSFGATIDGIIDRIVKFVSEVRQMLGMKGYARIEDVFRRIESGEVGARSPQMEADRMAMFADKPITPGLDMSQEARLQRARDMGFDTEQVWYHGTIEDFDAFGTGGGSKSANPEGAYAFSMSPDIASSYTRPLGIPSREGQRIDRELDKARFDFENKNQGEILKNLRRLRKEESARVGKSPEGENIIPVYLRYSNPLEIDAAGRMWTNVNDGVYRGSQAALEGADIAKDIPTLTSEAMNAGHDALIVRNVIDPGNNSSHIVSDTIIIFDPSNIRSVNAAFDPAHEGSSKLMYSFAGERAATADHRALDQAKQMEAEGLSREDVWRETGWFRGVDGKWQSGAETLPQVEAMTNVDAHTLASMEMGEASRMNQVGEAVGACKR